MSSKPRISKPGIGEPGIGEPRIGLVADIGGTNARFALTRLAPGPPRLEHMLSLPGHDYPGVEAAARDYLDRVGKPEIAAAAAACAGPVIDGAVVFTNVPWRTSEAAFGAALGLGRVRLINDLAAVAWAVPALGAESVRQVGPALSPAPASTRAILNAGTGCNASAFIEGAGAQLVIAGEYGHAGFAPEDALDREIHRHLRASFGRVSIERVLCGPGLLNLYSALAAIDGVAAPCASPAAISAAAAAQDGLAQRTIARFCAILGSVAGDVALCYGARAGVYLSGGVAALLLTPGRDRSFRSRFEDKGRFRPYLAQIPTLLIQDSAAGLLGAARALAIMVDSKPG